MRRVVVAAACLFLGFAAEARASVLVTISKSEQRMSVAVDGSERYRWPVSTGRPGYSTPTGSFRPYRLEESWFSRRFDSAPMPHSVFFHYGYAVHGTMEESRLGRPVSHGCVRLNRTNAHVLFHLVKQHGFAQSRVVVTEGPLSGGSAPRMPDPPAPRYDRGPDVRRIAPPAYAAKPAAYSRASFEDFDPPRSRNKYTAAGKSSSYHVSDEAELRRIYKKYGLKW